MLCGICGYIGQVKNGAPNGKVQEHNCGYKFEYGGNYDEALNEENLYSADTFVGEFKDRKRHGNGIFFANGTTILGIWKNGALMEGIYNSFSMDFSHNKISYSYKGKFQKTNSNNICRQRKAQYSTPTGLGTSEKKMGIGIGYQKTE